HREITSAATSSTERNAQTSAIPLPQLGHQAEKYLLTRANLSRKPTSSTDQEINSPTTTAQRRREDRARDPHRSSPAPAACTSSTAASMIRSGKCRMSRRERSTCL